MSKNAEVLPRRTAGSATRQPSLATLTRQPAYIEPLRNKWASVEDTLSIFTSDVASEMSQVCFDVESGGGL